MTRAAAARTKGRLGTWVSGHRTMRRNLAYASLAPAAEALRGRSRVFGPRSSALLLALLMSACTFKPDPLIAVDPSFQADRGSVDVPAVREDASRTDALDAELPADAAEDAGSEDASATDATPDAEPVPTDSGMLDGGVPDLGEPDAMPADALPRDALPGDALARDASPDAMPRDAMAPDAMPADAAPRDASLDAGTPDSGRDGGAGPADTGVDGGCAAPPWVIDGTPRSLASVPVALAADIDLPPLVADFDGDGQEEVAVASLASGEIAIIDWPACAATPIVTTTLLFVGPAGLALAQLGGREVIVTAALSGELRLATYDGPMQLTVATRAQAGFTGLSSLVVHPLGTELLATGTRPAGSAYVVPRPIPVARSLPDTLVGDPAYVTGVPSGARYAIATRSSLLMAVPDQPTDVTIPLLSQPTGSPAVLGGAYFDGNAGLSAIALGARTNGQDGLTIVVVDPVTAVGAQIEHIANTLPPMGGTIAYAEASGAGAFNAGFFQIRESGAATHVLQGCSIIRRPMPQIGFTCAPVPGSATLPGLVREGTTPITAYVSGSNAPDLVVATATPPRLAFYLPSLAPVGPVITLGGAAVATPALSTRFLSRYNIGGELVFVARSASIELVGWRRPATSGLDAVLWSQSRGDARRTGRL